MTKTGTSYKLINTYPVLCSSTDACIGQDEQGLGTFATLKAAEQALDEWHEAHDNDGYGPDWRAGEVRIWEVVTKRA